LKPDAGNTITVTRELSKGRIPLPGAADDPSGKYSIAHVNLRKVMEAHNPQDNIVVETNDVVMIPRAQLLYVVGEVQKPGGYILNERDSVTVLQAVALAGGLTQMASPKRAKVLHQDNAKGTRTELPTNVSKILSGKAPDAPLYADDILFVPNNLPKSAGAKALQTAINMAGVAVWRF
jgi:polysaccharide export outer membrane protein